MKDIKVHLPQTSFPMRGNLPVKEIEILKFWEEIDIYNLVRSKSKNRLKFILHDGPPYANGHIHIGTALNKILKDIVVRFNQLVGKDAPYVPGWDCHGLPIEWKVEEEFKKKGKNKDSIPINEFRKVCRDFAKYWIEIQKKEFCRLGVNGDWKNYYTTMHNSSEAQITREISKFLINGGLYRGFKPVLWSVVEATALADAEVEYFDKISNTVYVKFRIKKGPEKFLNASIIIWTTTPWTIPCNRALAFNKDINYCLINLHSGEKIIVASDLYKKVLEECKINEFKLIETFSGKNLENIICSHPFEKFGYDFNVPAFHGQFVSLEQGTGIVHLAPSHGPDDYYLCQKNGIEAFQSIDDKGNYTNQIKNFAGLNILKVDDKISDNLLKTGNLLGRGKLKHNYPHSWRSKAPLVHRATPQWFISMEANDLRKNAINSITKTSFYPAIGQNRLKSMIETRPDWCVSRQRVWGVPLPIFISKKTGEPLKDKKVLDKIADIFEKEGSDSWFEKDPSYFLGTDYNPQEFDQIKDIVEVWFDSGSSHTFVLEKRKDLSWPATMYLEGSDQHRGWFHSSLLHSSGTRGRAPYENILCHGFVVDGKGQKMSKSLGNVIAPEDVIKNYGADILRLWVVASDYSEDLKIDKNILDQHAESYRKIRNTIRFLLGNLNDDLGIDDIGESNYAKLPTLEKFILHRVFELDLQFKNYVSSYSFHKIYVELLNFCTKDLSALYFDIRKDILYCDELISDRRKFCLQTLKVLYNFLIYWFSPILVFTTEEAHQSEKNKKEKSVHLKEQFVSSKFWNNAEVFDKWERIKKIKTVVNSAIEDIRNKKIIGSNLEAIVKLYLDNVNMNSLTNEETADILVCSDVIIKSLDSMEADALTVSEIAGVGVKILKANGNKCPRCWKILDKVCKRDNCGLKN